MKRLAIICLLAITFGILFPVFALGVLSYLVQSVYLTGYYGAKSLITSLQ